MQVISLFANVLGVSFGFNFHFELFLLQTAFLQGSSLRCQKLYSCFFFKDNVIVISSHGKSKFNNFVPLIQMVFPLVHPAVSKRIFTIALMCTLAIFHLSVLSQQQLWDFQCCVQWLQCPKWIFLDLQKLMCHELEFYFCSLHYNFWLFAHFIISWLWLHNASASCCKSCWPIAILHSFCSSASCR